MNNNLSDCDSSLQGNEFPAEISAENLNCAENENSGSELLMNELIKTAKMVTPVKKKRNQIRHFQCEICEKMFYSRRHLEDHMKTHTGEKPHTCDICNRSFSQLSNFKRHLLVHTGERRFSCHICPKQFTYKEHYMAHMCIHTGERPFVCETCGRGFTRKQNMVGHMMTHSVVKPFACKVCGNTFKLKSSLSSHMSTHSEVPAYVCYICKISFKTKKGLKNHDISFSSFHDLKKSLGYDSFEENGKFATDHEMSHKCSECQKDFSCERDLQKHIQCHKLSATDHEMNYKCSECQRDFSCERDLQKHIQSHKLSVTDHEMNHKCSECQRTFSCERDLQKHIQCHKLSVTDHEMNHKCSECQRDFICEKDLQNHIQSHKLSKQFICNQCEKEFSKPSLLIRHMSSHAREKLLTQSCSTQSNMKSLELDICEKKFKAKKSLNSHLKTRKQVKSNEGSSGLIKSKTNHYSVLPTEKVSDTALLNTNTFAEKENFQCNVCRKMFAQQYLLNIHMLTHHVPAKESGPVKVFVVKFS